MIHRFIDLISKVQVVAYQKNIFNNGTSASYTQIWAVPALGGTPYAVTTQTTNGTNDTDPDLSPDGSQIVFLRSVSGSRTLYIVDAAGGTPTQLDSTAGCHAPMWHPDGSKILYGRGTTTFRTIEPDGSNNTALTISGPTGDAGIFHPTWNSDGTKIAFHSDFSSALTVDELWVCDANGSNAAKLSDASRGGLGGLGISWLHGSDVVVFVERISSVNQLSKINADGTGKTTLTNASITPSPTKYAISSDDVDAFVAQGDASPWTMYRVPIDASGQSAVSPTLDGSATVGRGQAWVFGERVYTVRSSDGCLVSILLDGSDLRVEDTPANGPTFFDTIALSGNGTEL